MAETITGSGSLTELTTDAVTAVLPAQGELLTHEDVLRENAADIITARRLKAALTLRQLVNQLEVFHEARDTIHMLLSATAADDEESLELARIMAKHASGAPLGGSSDMHELMDMAEVKAIDDLSHEVASGKSYSKAPLEVLQARFYASYRELLGADNIAPGETI